MNAGQPRSHRRLSIVLTVIAGHLLFFWQFAQGLEHRPSPTGPVWVHGLTLPEPSPPPAQTKTSIAPNTPSQPAEPSPALATPAQALLAAAPAAAQAPPVPVAPAPAVSNDRKTPERFAFAPPSHLLYEVSGKVKGFPYLARGSLLWQHDGRQYQAKYEVGLPLLGARLQTSQGSLGLQGLAPTRFGDKNKTELAAHFEREKGLISFSANTPASPLLPGAQDRLSLFMQLSAQLAAEPQRYPGGTQIDMQTVSAREAEVWSFVVEGEELLSLPMGNVQALRLRRLPRREFDQNIELWFAPGLSYLPVRIRLQQANGDVADQRAKSIAAP